MKSKINCENIKINALLSNELAPNEKQLTIQHINNCPSCKLNYLQIKKADELLEMFNEVEPPKGLISKVIKNSKPKIKVYKYSKLAIAASVLFGLLTGLFLSQEIINQNNYEKSIEQELYQNNGLYSLLGEYNETMD